MELLHAGSGSFEIIILQKLPTKMKILILVGLLKAPYTIRAHLGKKKC